VISPKRVPYVLQFSKRSLKDFEKLEARVRQQIWAGLGQVCAEGVGDIKALKGELKGLIRVRVGEYRIVIQVVGSTVFVVEVSNRKDAYR
jgi:mRNA interferase RelE/StbE